MRPRIDTPGMVSIGCMGKTRPVQGLRTRREQKSSKKVSKKGEKHIAIYTGILYNTSVVCLGMKR